MEKKIFTISENHHENYLATIQRVGELYPIENSDRLCRAVVDGFDVIVPNTMKPEDIVVYVPVESALCEGYLAANNDYEISEWQRNSNANEVGVLLAKGDPESRATAKSKVGFFGKNGRVRIVKLRGVPSCGYIAPVSSLETYNSALVGMNWETLIGTSFDEILGEKFCWKYVAPVKETANGSHRRERKREKTIKRFDRIIPGTFTFHYDTTHINKEMWKFSPDDVVTISVKVHGTSAIFANIPTNRKLSFVEKIKKFFGKKIETVEYGNIYSSRNTIKNRYLNPDAHDYYNVDVWGVVNDMFGPYIDKGMTVYGEIVGYVPGSADGAMIQKRHDYGCEPGEWKFMPYRISTITGDGTKVEWNLTEVDEWTHNLVKEHPELEKNVLFLDILYHGRFGDLYPDIDEHLHWQENVLERMKNDKEHFLMEELEPKCRLYEPEYNAAVAAYEKAKTNGEPKKVLKTLQEEIDKWYALRAPREGVVIRKDNDPIAEAWKLKTNAHRFGVEARAHDEGEFDMEEAEGEGCDYADGQGAQNPNQTS